MNYEKYMNICIQLAKNGEGKVSPNPLVGCVILDREGNQISTGFHTKYGENHAERDALLKLHNGEEKEGTLIVNLEPCSHFGKTPPCTDLIIERGIKKVVVGMRDVNPKVSGIQKLKDAGIEIVEGVLEKECRKLNEIFIKNMTQNKPFVALKTASTLDGKIATNSGSSKWITSEIARENVKKIRNRYDAILTTSSTVLKDNPKMLHKKKIILDRKLKTDLKSEIYQNGEIYIFCHPEFISGSEMLKQVQHDNIAFIQTPLMNNKLDIEFVFKKAFELGIKSILIEAGGHLNGSALEYVDKIYHFFAPKITGDNSSISCFDYRKISEISECKNFTIESAEKLGGDILLTYYPIQ